MAYFPLFMDLEEKEILVIGAGVVAARRVRVLLAFGCRITVISPSASQELLELERENRIKIILLKFQQTDRSTLKKPWMILAASGDGEADRMAVEYAKDTGAMINVAGDKSASDFYFPGIVRKDPVVIGVTAQGNHHRLAAQITRQIENLMDQGQIMTEESED